MSIPGRVTVIDGGFSTQLAFHVGSNIDGDPLWSARYNAAEPEAVIQTHLDFLENGAEIILTNTYQASVEGYTEYLKLDRVQSIDLIKSTVKLAQTAREKFLKSSNQEKTPLIFASIGPYGAHLHDGSEYTGSYATTVSSEAIKKWHRVRMAACVEAGIDGFAIETIPCRMEAEAVVDLIIEEFPDIKFWVSFQCKVDGKTLANGEDFSEAVESIWRKCEDRKNTNLVAVGVNCIAPDFVSELCKSIKIKVPIVVYPNSGETYNVETGWQGKNKNLALEDYVNEWVGLGARFIGGCCRSTAKDIKKINEKVELLR